MVPADPNVEEGDGRGLPDTRSARKTDGKGVTMFEMSDRTSRVQRR